MGTRPDGVIALASGQTVQVGEIAISMADFCELVVYAMTNTDLVADDPRLNLMSQLAKLNPVPGYSVGYYRLGVSGPSDLFGEQAADRGDG